MENYVKYAEKLLKIISDDCKRQQYTHCEIVSGIGLAITSFMQELDKEQYGRFVTTTLKCYVDYCEAENEQ